jgi:hypothetical protein
MQHPWLTCSLAGLVSVYLLPGANALEVAKRVRESDLPPISWTHS